MSISNYLEWSPFLVRFYLQYMGERGSWRATRMGGWTFTSTVRSTVGFEKIQRWPRSPVDNALSDLAANEGPAVAETLG